MAGLQTKGHKAWAFLGIPIRVNLQFIVTVFVFLTYKCKKVHNVLATNHRRCKNHHWRLHVLWIVLFCCEPANRFGAARTETSHLMVCQSYFHSEIQNTCVNSCNNSITIHFEYNTQYSFRRRAVWILRGWGEKRSLCPLGTNEQECRIVEGQPPACQYRMCSKVNKFTQVQGMVSMLTMWVE